MKKIIRSNKWLFSLSAVALVLFGTLALTAARSRGTYSAHEWGTFTSVQGTDGVLLDWRPLQSSRLPGFVYNWAQPGLNRRSAAPMALTKAAITTLQRMETPVIYFYSDEEQSVDVSVQFPQGTITEWYPQAAQIGPSVTAVPPAVAKLDEYAHKVGARRGFTFASLFGDKNVKDSKVRWANVRLLPARSHEDVVASLPADRSGSHYFAARETDADFVRIGSLVATNPSPEQEKFLFYRGVGNFATPLKVTMKNPEEVVLANTGKEPLQHLFLLGLENQSGGFVEVDQLAAGEQRTVRVSLHDSALGQLVPKLSAAVAKSLVQEGLFEKEATAMVNTWKDSWFAEDGLRVLYTLPRQWTDRVLPLTLDPAPRNLVRVMVGRAEVLTSAVQQNLSDALTRAETGDTAARAEAVAQLRKLGRFSEPALKLAMKQLKPDRTQVAWTLFQEASRPATKPL
jgi:hypothetical protein